VVAWVGSQNLLETPDDSPFFFTGLVLAERKRMYFLAPGATRPGGNAPQES
jgi:hypothetical protein